MTKPSAKSQKAFDDAEAHAQKFLDHAKKAEKAAQKAAQIATKIQQRANSLDIVLGDHVLKQLMAIDKAAAEVGKVLQGHRDALALLHAKAWRNHTGEDVRKGLVES